MTLTPRLTLIGSLSCFLLFSCQKTQTAAPGAGAGLLTSITPQPVLPQACPTCISYSKIGLHLGVTTLYGMALQQLTGAHPGVDPAKPVYRLRDSLSGKMAYIASIKNTTAFLVLQGAEQKQVQKLPDGTVQVLDLTTGRLTSLRPTPAPAGSGLSVISPWWDCMVASMGTLTDDLQGQITCGLFPQFCVAACLIACAGKSTDN